MSTDRRSRLHLVHLVRQTAGISAYLSTDASVIKLFSYVPISSTSHNQMDTVYHNADAQANVE